MAGSATSERVATLPTASGPDGVVTAGPVMAIGGAEDKLRDKLILSAFVQLAGGPDARIAIVPTASSIEEAGERYKALFLGMGAESADVLYLPDRAAADVTRGRSSCWTTSPASSSPAATRCAWPASSAAPRWRARCAQRNEAGAVVAGTSAGASILSSHMVAFGASGPSPRHAHGADDGRVRSRARA